MKKVILFLTLILLLTSCGEKSLDINKKDTEILQEEVSTNTSYTTLISVNDEIDRNSQNTIEFDKFMPIQDAFEKSGVNVDYSKDDLKYTINVKGEIDLNSDGKKIQ